MRDIFAVLFIPNSPALFGISTTLLIIIVAIVLVAVAAAIIGLVVFRGGKSKQPATPGAPGGMQGWQGSGQPVDNAWGMQPQAQQPGAWGVQPQAQQPQPGAWGVQPQAQQPQPDSWGMQPQAQQPPGAWGVQPQAQQPQPGAWGSQGLPSPIGPGSSPIGSQPSWDATPSPAANDPWGQAAPQQQGMPAWGSTTPASPQSGPTPYGGGQSWGQPAQPQPADPWAAPSAQQPQSAQPGAWSQPLQQPSSSPFTAPGNSATPPWQQQGPGTGGFGGMGGATVVGQEPTALYGSSESDKTVLRNTGGPQVRLGIVRVEEGKDPGRVYEVRKDTFSIGRSRESDIFLEDLAVSRLHASIVNVNGNYALKDEGSANGTKVNGQLVTKHQTYPLQEGDKIQLGQTVLVFGKR